MLGKGDAETEFGGGGAIIGWAPSIRYSSSKYFSWERTRRESSEALEDFGLVPPPATAEPGVRKTESKRMNSVVTVAIRAIGFSPSLCPETAHPAAMAPWRHGTINRS